MALTPDQVAALVSLWSPVIGELVSLGVKSWSVIRSLLEDAGADQATIAALQPQWDSLLADVQRASQE